MKKLLSLSILLLCMATYKLDAQVANKRTPSISVNFKVDTPSIIEFFEPASLVGTRGFEKIKEEKINVSGKVSDKEGLKELKINGLIIGFNSDGNFETSMLLNVGSNKLTVEVVDQKGNIVTKSYTIEREEPLINETSSDYYALLIANQNYDDDLVVDLDQPIQDANKLKDVLLNKYSFKPENLILLEDPSRSEILDQLDYLSRKVDDKDNVLIFYAGHGYWDEKFNTGYWFPRDARPPKVSKSAWFGNSTLRDYINGINSKHTLLIADACFSGGIFKSRVAFADATIGINKLQKLTSRKAMTSGTLTEVPDKSIFMKYLIQRLYENDDKYMTSESLFASFKTAVLNNSPNVPQYGTVQNAGDEGGDFIFILKE